MFGQTIITITTIPFIRTTLSSDKILNSKESNYGWNGSSLRVCLFNIITIIDFNVICISGGFGFVFRVRDLKTSSIYALKRLIASDNDTKKEIENEIEVLTRLQPHKHIMQFISWGKNQSKYLSSFEVFYY